MALFEQMKQDRLEAFKAKQNAKKDLLGCVIAEASKTVKEPDDATVTATIKKFIANSKLILDKRPDDAQASYEIDVLNSYLPKQLTETEIKIIVARFSRPINIGDVQKHFKENYAGRYDGGMVSKVAKEMTS